MSFRDLLASNEARVRLQGLLFALCAILSVPSPTPGLGLLTNGILVSLWLFLALFSWSLWYRPDLTHTLWILCLVLAFLALLKLFIVLPLIMIICWRLWYRLRVKR